MEIKINIDEAELQELITQKIAANITHRLFKAINCKLWL